MQNKSTHIFRHLVTDPPATANSLLLTSTTPTMKLIAPSSRGKPGIIHPAWLRLGHWLNAIAVIVLQTSGWRIYNATRFFGFTIAPELTLGGWLGGALQWHFAAMWLLAANGVLYFAINLATGRLRRQFFPITVRQLLRDIGSALRGQLSHADPRHYNLSLIHI